jgi:ankyrin repeat protein
MNAETHITLMHAQFLFKAVIASVLVSCLISAPLLQASSEQDAKSVPYPTLVQAVRARESESVKKLLAAGHNPSWQNNSGITLLWRATHNNDIATVKLLVDAKADLDGNYVQGSGVQASKGDPAGRTVLMKAADKDQLEMARIFIAAGANVNKRDMFDCSALQLAADKGHPEMVCELLKAGAIIDARELAAAQERGDQRVLDLLYAAPVTQKTGAVLFKELVASRYAAHAASGVLAVGLLVCSLLSS